MPEQATTNQSQEQVNPAIVNAVNGQDTETHTETETAPEQQQQQQQQQDQQQEQPKTGGSLLSTMTQAQIDAIPDPTLRAQVQALVNSNKQLAARAKEKDPTWRELAPYGKGTAGIKVSDNGTIQITGTRRAFGGLYIFPKEMLLIFEHGQKIADFMRDNAQLITQRLAAAEAARAKEKKEKGNK